MSLDAIIADLQKDKKFTITVSKLSDPGTLARVTQWVSTGNVALDTILGGGFPVRRITEIYGDNSTGKSLLATMAAIDTQEQGGLVAYCDIEVALGYDRMIDLGVDPEQMIYVAPDTIDDVLTTLDKLIELKNKHYSKETILTFIFDSVAALATQDELETDSYEVRNYPNAARYISAAMRKLKNKVAANNVCLILINQTREKLGVMFGDGVATYGGRAVGFYSTVRIELKNVGKLKSGSNVVGVNTKATVVKNRLAPPYRQVTLPIYYSNAGISEALTVFNLLKSEGMLSQSGAWYTLFDGTDKELKFQQKNFPDVFDEHFDDIVILLEDHFSIYAEEVAEEENDDDSE